MSVLPPKADIRDRDCFDRVDLETLPRPYSGLAEITIGAVEVGCPLL
jgi:hypothetical protein